MSSEARGPAIDVRNVGKQYRVGAGAEGRLAEAVQRWARSVVRRGAAPSTERFWALRELSLTIEQNEVVGIIGRNGAGKSTLLKLLSRITAPTEGEIVMRGRVASLLEVGAGFDHEMTGRENIYLSGAIMGMRAAQINRKFDEIVAFSGIERFIDTPVKRYSSGMFVRLAFAVGAHLEPDILLVDEVLAVGDAEFQHKCLDRMHAIAREGRTVMFVSHNLPAVQRLCPRALLLDRGRLVADGPSADVITRYRELVGAEHPQGGEADVSGIERAGIGGVRLQRMSLRDPEDRPVDRLAQGQPLTVALAFRVENPMSDAIFRLGVSTADGLPLLTAHSTDGGSSPTTLEPGLAEVRVRLDAELIPGEFLVDVAVLATNGDTIDQLDGAFQFSVVSVHDDASDLRRRGESRGGVRPPSTWSLSSAQRVAAT